MKYRLKNTYMCVINECPEVNKPKTIWIDADINGLFPLPTFLCVCLWEPKLVHQEQITEKFEPPLDPTP